MYFQVNKPAETEEGTKETAPAETEEGTKEPEIDHGIGKYLKYLKSKMKWPLQYIQSLQDSSFVAQKLKPLTGKRLTPLKY